MKSFSLSQIPREFAKGLLKGYQSFLSPFLGPRCRFYPSCSEYSSQCFQRFSFFAALWYSARRLVRCHPFSPGGVDLVEEIQKSGNLDRKRDI